MKIKNFLLLALAVSISLNGQDSQDLSLIKRSYNQFKRDLALVTKCYFFKKFTCTENDVKEARQVALRLSGEAVGLVALLGSAAAGSYYLYGKSKKPTTTVHVITRPDPAEYREIKERQKRREEQLRQAREFDERFNHRFF